MKAANIYDWLPVHGMMAAARKLHYLPTGDGLYESITPIRRIVDDLFLRISAR